ncbi:type I-E CRISPR-associated endonuclease Cas1e [Anthocerotibacter panamensis]|uniref:type I-E CRISPR-associated endonuclease Cas1e n=1 Tax=Anthocerotibacter panamensis TaxID=2857077 RepID=UPI001C4069F3|nr:type I-E CRISPR-associated endonuclease Cas1e [Anthocerotibacter panamensis]
MLKSLRILPKVRDSWSFLYIDHCRVEQEAKAIAIYDQKGKTPVPCATLNLLMLGPGTSITHAAIRALAENGCMVAWTGEAGVRMYAHGLGETRDSRRLLKQAYLCAHDSLRLMVVRKMYEIRFSEPLEASLTLQQIRGKEGVRVRDAYARASKESGVPWTGRVYKQEDWGAADPINRALSAANSCLYGVCHAAIVAAGYSPALGFVHTGKMLSFVYDVADLYKVEMTIPIAFKIVAESPQDLESRVRHACRDAFHEHRLLARVVEDIDRLLAVDGASLQPGQSLLDLHDAMPGGLWDPESGNVSGGVNWSEPIPEG